MTGMSQVHTAMSQVHTFFMWCLSINVILYCIYLFFKYCYNKDYDRDD